MPPSLEAVLRAGQAREVATEAESECLTRALKRTSLVATGACLPRGFDPDYCAYDRYYAIGVSLVSAALGALVNSSTVWDVNSVLAARMSEALGNLCHTPKEDGWVFSNPQAKFYHYMNEYEKRDAREGFGKLCNALHATAVEYEMASLSLFRTPLSYEEVGRRLKNKEGLNDDLINAHPYNKPNDRLGYRILLLLVGPAIYANKALHNLTIPDAYTHILSEEEEQTFLATLAVLVAWRLKYISRYMNEHVLMIASFFRVNAKRMHNKQPLMLDLKAFVQKCHDDIADGPNPPPPPPTAEELAAARAYAEAEKRRQAHLVDEVMKMPTVMASYE